MNLETVISNLKNTIAGKERALEGYHEDYKLCTMAEGIALTATIEFLTINIDELKRILQDVEQCVFDYDELKDDLKEANGRVRQLEKQASDDSWITNPDRMGGGGWTADELDPNRGWK